MNTTAVTSRSNPDPATLARPSLASTIALHLVPGAIFAAVVFAAVAPMRDAGIPPIGTFVLFIATVLIPLELGYLFWRGRQRTGRMSLAGVVSYREPMPLRSYALWVPTLFIVAFGIFAVWSLFAPSLMDTVFAWVPDWFDDPFGLDEPERYSRTTLLIIWVAAIALNGIAGPLVEELYFRGHLLPRLERLGPWAPVVNTLLFALYHFWSPWQLVSRMLGLLPLYYLVWRRRNFYVAIIVHTTLNTIGLLLVLPRILNVA